MGEAVPFHSLTDGRTDLWMNGWMDNPELERQRYTDRPLLHPFLRPKPPCPSLLSQSFYSIIFYLIPHFRDFEDDPSSLGPPIP